MPGDDPLGRPAKISRAAVVTQSLPQSQNLLLVRLSKRHQSRKLPQEAVVVRDDRRHLRLLKHRLADQNVIWIKLSRAAGTPGQIPPVWGLQGQQPTSKGLRTFREP